MSIQEFHFRMKSDAASGALFEALKRLRGIEGASIICGEAGDDPLGPWNPWHEPDPS